MLLEDFREVAEALVGDGRMPAAAEWVEDFADRMEEIKSSASLDGLL